MKRIFWMVLLFTLVWQHTTLRGQWISPGKLSAPHAFLEGVNNCTLCHNIGEKITEAKCLACHSKIDLQLQDQRGYHFLHREESCTECHHEHRGVETSLIKVDEKTFDHAKLGFALEGRHQKLQCTECHRTPGTYSGLTKTCLACHDDSFHGRMDEKCEKCHSFDAFKPSTFRHPENALAALHGDVECNSCHLNGQFRGQDKSCLTCHDDEHKGQLAANCESCHRFTQFDDLKFVHNQQAAFKLDSAHTKVLCEDCHANGVYEQATACNACHADAHKGQLGPNCETCHVTEDFTQVKFRHDAPRHVLEGKHRNLQCESCHPENNYNTPKTCAACHEDEHKGELNQKCETCHTANDFLATTFRHESPNYELSGAHQKLACNSCHAGAQYRRLDTQCTACHQEEHKGDVTGQCEACHTVHQFKPATFRHPPDHFQSQGKHKETACTECHSTGLFKSLSQECATCHADVHQGKLGENCTQCHQFDTWRKVAYDHNASDYLLKGRHLDLKCEECHVQGVFAGTRTECFNCHRDPHQTRFGQDCETCHTEDGWSLMQYNHDQSGYPLQGVHEQLECSACHPQDRIVGTPQNCYGCHRLDFEAAIEPNHKAAKFSIECEECHKVTDVSWELGSWLEHESIFPLRSSSAGHHANFSCQECHPSATNYKNYNCLACHVRDEMDAAHTEVRKYKYQNNKCLDCHPAGEIEELEDDH